MQAALGHRLWLLWPKLGRITGFVVNRARKMERFLSHCLRIHALGSGLLWLSSQLGRSRRMDLVRYRFRDLEA